MSASSARRERRATQIIQNYLAALDTNRPSALLADGRSSKGARAIRSILEAARRVFVRVGHGGLTMRKVAEEAGLVVGNFNYYFPSKRALIEAMLREELADYVDQHIRLYRNRPDQPLEVLLATIAHYVSRSRDSSGFFFQMWGYAGGQDDARPLLRSLYTPIARFYYYLVRAANTRLTDGRARQVVLQILSLQEGAKLMLGMAPADDPEFDAAEMRVRNAARLIVLNG